MGIIDEYAQALAASHELARPLDAFAKRLIRIEKDAAEEVYGRLKKRQRTTGPIYAERDWKDSKLARGMRDGIEEFKKLYPKHGTVLEAIIKKQRKVRRNYLSYGYDDLSYEFFDKVFEKLGIPKNERKGIYETATDISNRLKAQKQPIKRLME